MTIVPKSGWPVLGQTAVNSGQVISISYSRSGNWFGKVSSRLAIGDLLGIGPVETATGGHPPGPPRVPENQPPRLRPSPRLYRNDGHPARVEAAGMRRLKESTTR